ncbi:bi-domain-containing oxidoreductase [Steroidobacter flavus]|uniref:Bi-domain-containing oxidoreductase n=1 Tax=Steroidobacter flavus TaxID=1842136 RepID=A0ABV8T372_9GAMM
MRQILQSLANGRTEVAEVPAPRAPRNGVSIRTTRSLISAGTERMLVDFGRSGWLEKARQQPDRVRQVLQKARTDGLLQTIDAVRSKLDQPLPLGYCNVGVVVEAGAEANGFSVGDRVVSNGAHAEVVAVPRNLCARIPPNVSDDAAAFTVLGAIALQGIRLAAPTLGERFVVTGLGLIGLMAVQLLRANGCKVLGIDPDPAKAALAREFGADVVALDKGEDPLAVAAAFSSGQGVDGVIITAATSSNEPVSQGAKMCRQRGRIILVGVAGLDLDRADFYTKELSFQVSCSYGPGRYDPQYEEAGQDYPFGFVRWTEQRNFEAVLDMMAAGSLNVTSLITHRFAFDQAPAAYELLAAGGQPYLGILLEYAERPEQELRVRTVQLNASGAATSAPRVAFIGAGNYAGRVLIPAFKETSARMQGISSGKGVTAAHFGRKYGFASITTDSETLLSSPDVDAVVIATRHDSHAHFVCKALQAGKHVFVEKPLAIAQEQLTQIANAWEAAGSGGTRPQVMVGFNRRFAPQVQRMKSLLGGVREPKSVMITVNAGAIPRNHWTQDPAVGGGRVIGEGCHFIDLARFLVAQPIVESSVRSMGGNGLPVEDDNVAITLGFADGSWATIQYLANGHRAFPKERIEVFCAGRILQLDNFRRLRGEGWSGFSGMNLWRQDKGQQQCAAAFVRALESGAPAPIPFEELLEVSRVSIELGEAARH